MTDINEPLPPVTIAPRNMPAISPDDIMPGGWVSRLVAGMLAGRMPRQAIMEYLFQFRPARLMPHNGNLQITMDAAQATRMAIALQRSIVGSDLESYCEAHGLSKEDYTAVCVTASFLIDAVEKLQRSSTIIKP